MPPFRINSRTVLEEGDKIRVSGGPYYLSSSGMKTRLGERGLGVFKGVNEDGTGIHVLFNGDQVTKYVYIGPEKVSPTTGTILCPHKISKIRKKKKEQ
jgi:hypothetical protein